MPSLLEDRFRCCCGLTNVKIGSWIIAILHLALIIASAVLYFVFVFKDEHDETYKWAVTWPSIAGWVINAIAVLCLVLGLITEKAFLLLPYIILTGLTLFVLYLLKIAIIVCYIIFIFASHEGKFSKWYLHNVIPDAGSDPKWYVSLGYTVARLVGIIILAAFVKVFLYTVNRCRRYFLELAEERGKGPRYA